MNRSVYEKGIVKICIYDLFIVKKSGNVLYIISLPALPYKWWRCWVLPPSPVYTKKLEIHKFILAAINPNDLFYPDHTIVLLFLMTMSQL